MLQFYSLLFNFSVPSVMNLIKPMLLSIPLFKKPIRALSQRVSLHNYLSSLRCISLCSLVEIPPSLAVISIDVLKMIIILHNYVAGKNEDNNKVQLALRWGCLKSDRLSTLFFINTCHFIQRMIKAMVVLKWKKHRSNSRALFSTQLKFLMSGFIWTCYN